MVIVDFAQVRFFGTSQFSGMIPGTCPDHIPLKSLCCEFCPTKAQIRTDLTVLERTCKLDVPKCSKRTMQNNPWITGGIFASISQCHGVYNLWVKSRKVKFNEGENDSKGGSCFCNICAEKRRSYEKYKNYRRRKYVMRQNQSITLINLWKTKVIVKNMGTD